MENPTNKQKPFVSRMWCSLFGHHYITTRNVTNHFKEFECSACRIQLTNDEKGHKIFLTPELRDINETLFSFYHKRHPIV